MGNETADQRAANAGPADRNGAAAAPVVLPRETLPTGPADRASAGPSLLPTAADLIEMRNTAELLVRSGLLPRAVDTPEKAVVIILKGHELGLKPMVAFEHIHVIEGTPRQSAALMIAQIRKHYPRARVLFRERTGERCVIDASRPGEQLVRFEWTIEDARRAGLLHEKKHNWHAYPRHMLTARCVTEVAKTLFPEILVGFGPTDVDVDDDLELADVGGDAPATPAPPAAPARQERAAPPPPKNRDARPYRERGETIYTGGEEDARMLRAVAKGKRLPDDRLDELHGLMMNRPITDGAAVIDEMLRRPAAGESVGGAQG